MIYVSDVRKIKYVPRYLGSRNVNQVLEFLVTLKTFRSKGLSQVRNGGYVKKAIHS